MKLLAQAQNGALYAAGLVLGAANTVRHQRQGYVNPRPFSAADVERTIDHALEIVDRWEVRGGVQWEGQRVLEIGPGSDLTTGAIALAKGADSYTAVDLFDTRAQAADGLYDRLNVRLGSEVDPGDLEFVQTSFPALPGLRGTYDLIISNACLEHVSDVGPLFQRLRQLASPAARMVHHIDAKAHMRWFREHDPLNHLRYSDWVYKRLLDFPGAPNRLRAGEFADLADAAGWMPTIVPGRRAGASYLATASRGRQLQHRRDLELLTFTLVAHLAGH